MSSPHPGQGHRQRLRDKFLAHGLDKFTDEEVLELLLTLATPRRDCKQQARQLMTQKGSLQAVLDAPVEDLASVKGIGPKNVLGLKLIPQVARRYLEDGVLNQPSLSDPAQVLDYFRFTMRPLQKEVFRVIYLDKRQRVKAVEDMAEGTLDQAVVYPRELVARALGTGAGAVICAHNHPSGDPTPSQADKDLTRRLFYACRGVEIDLLDHLVVAGDEIYSFADQGYIRALMREHRTLNL